MKVKDLVIGKKYFYDPFFDGDPEILTYSGYDKIYDYKFNRIDDPLNYETLTERGVHFFIEEMI